jgi:hypothetical protein
MQQNHHAVVDFRLGKRPGPFIFAHLFGCRIPLHYVLLWKQGDYVCFCALYDVRPTELQPVAMSLRLSYQVQCFNDRNAKYDALRTKLVHILRKLLLTPGQVSLPDRTYPCITRTLHAPIPRPTMDDEHDTACCRVWTVDHPCIPLAPLWPISSRREVSHQSPTIRYSSSSLLRCDYQHHLDHDLPTSPWPCHSFEQR